MPISEQEARIATAGRNPATNRGAERSQLLCPVRIAGSFVGVLREPYHCRRVQHCGGHDGDSEPGRAADSFQQGNYGEGAGQLAMAYFKMDLLVGGPVAEGVNLTVGAAFEGLGLGISPGPAITSPSAGAYTADCIGGLTGDLAGEAFGGTMEGLAPSGNGSKPRLVVCNWRCCHRWRKSARQRGCSSPTAARPWVRWNRLRQLTAASSSRLSTARGRGRTAEVGHTRFIPVQLETSASR